MTPSVFTAGRSISIVAKNVIAWCIFGTIHGDITAVSPNSHGTVAYGWTSPNSGQHRHNRQKRAKGDVMTKGSKVIGVELLACDAGWRNYHFVKLTTDDGVVGWSEFDEGFGSPGIGAAIQRLSVRVVGQNVFQHERIYAELFAATRPAAGGVVAQALGAIENALLDAKAKCRGVPCYHVLAGNIRARIRTCWCLTA